MRKFLRKITDTTTFSKFLFVYSLCALSFAFGYLSLAGHWFPHRLVVKTKDIIEEIRDPENRGHVVKTDFKKKVLLYDEEAAYNGLSLYTSGIDNRKIAVSVISMEGELVHRWDTDWFKLWPEATHIPKSDPIYPISRPGTHVHGVLLLENGDLIFNFEYLGLVRLDVCGNVIWKLPYRTHHAIYLDENDSLWVPGLVVHDESLPSLPYLKPPIFEPTVLKVSLDGKILKEISVIEILRENDLHGLLYLSSLDIGGDNASGDILHLNDVETFPNYLGEGVFKTGDVMISLRNINTILIFSQDDLEAKHVSIGPFVRQHDPDFIDGNTISVFDNLGPEENDYQSRILIKSFQDGQHSVYYSGNEKLPFYSSVLGKHQWLPNGNLLITESMKGRAFEIDPQGNIVWDYVNIVRPGYAGIVEEVQRLPDIFSEEYFDELSNQCNQEHSD